MFDFLNFSWMWSVGILIALAILAIIFHSALGDFFAKIGGDALRPFMREFGKIIAAPLRLRWVRRGILGLIVFGMGFLVWIYGFKPSQEYLANKQGTV